MQFAGFFGHEVYKNFRGFVLLFSVSVNLLFSAALRRIDFPAAICYDVKKRNGSGRMELKIIPHSFTVCKVERLEPADLEGEFCFVGKTDEELSLVCLTERTPNDTLQREDGWRAFRIQGVLDFSLIGILAPIAELLAQNRIGIFAVSTYNTDYVLVKQENFEKAIQALMEAGYCII